MALERSLPEILGAFRDAVLNDIRKKRVAKVTAVDVAKQTVDCEEVVNNTLHDELGQGVSEPAPSHAGVPIGCLRAGGFMIWLPVAVGDYVELLFNDLDLDNWRSTGQPGDPGWTAKHTASSPTAIPMVAPDTTPLASAAAGQLVIGKDGSDQQIIIDGSFVKLGASATDFVALAAKVLTELTKIQTTLATGVANLSTGNVVFGTPYSPSPVAATLVKAE